MTQLKIRQLNKSFGISLTVAGIKGLRSSYNNLVYDTKSTSYVKIAITKEVNVPIVNKDYDAYFTSWENWQQMLDTMYNIIKNFSWERERLDCDDRARLVSGLCSLIYRINTCGQVYCEYTDNRNGNTGRHYANIIIDNNMDVYLFDVDNGGLTTKIEEGLPTTMGNWSYKFLSVELS
jgi:hypothetical protein